jgi:hypothetical protein
MKLASKFGLALLLLLTGCAARSPVSLPVCPPPAIQHVRIVDAQVNKRYLVQFAAAPAKYIVCGQVPSGLKVSVVNGSLWLGGIPTQAGDFVFQIVGVN